MIDFRDPKGRITFEGRKYKQKRFIDGKLPPKVFRIYFSRFFSNGYSKDSHEIIKMLFNFQIYYIL